ncbi:conserved hypothetical protein [Beutenbergia cavernae DSM 12333]|uniref:Trp biosynthesis associated, transmembrane protein, Oprn/Chp n=1 Tax=Beutenbergia cavernae (strain ATCC BAA-8 / DSM 12333 / CCUG 43141 / JCM 11478 / NBRC 16432 / NCIMB 13614 / HKI 0122) TaxID=471853 RepID=C5BV90_BEUC1|nr:Trp biosynthesis-associated membrane protein [Beutenbergia cavernae]ACQ80477.1 conserved hypothetical protein [Beutenbergia cavernae DSM 12333]
MTAVLSRGRAALASGLAGGVLLATSATPWASAAVASLVGDDRVTVSGADAAPAVPALGIIALASALALALAGPVLRRVVAIVLAAAGLAVVVLAVGVMRDPGPALRSAAAELTGVPELAGAVTTTAWGWVCAVAGLATAALGVALLSSRRSWGTSSRRYERAGAAPSTPPQPEADRPRSDREEAMDDWDALSRGEDPTADR